MDDNAYWIDIIWICTIFHASAAILAAVQGDKLATVFAVTCTAIGLAAIAYDKWESRNKRGM